MIGKIVSTFEISVQHCGNFKYIGLDLTQVGSEIQLNQDTYIQELEYLELPTKRAKQTREVLTPEERLAVKSVCGQLLWVANNTRPDLSYDTCQLSNIGKTGVVGDIMKLNRVIRKAKQESVKVSYPNLGDPLNWSVIVYCDASFANLADGSSQGGFIVFLSSPDSTVAPMSWQSRKLHRVTRSTLSSECLAMCEAVDAAFLLKKQIVEVLGILPPVIVHTDNRSLHQTLHTSRILSDKSLRVHIGFLRQMVNKGDIEVKWTNAGNQIADCMTKQGSSSALLLDVLKTSHL